MLIWSEGQHNIGAARVVASFSSCGIHVWNSVGVVGGVRRPNWIDLDVRVGVEGSATPTTSASRLILVSDQSGS